MFERIKGWFSRPAREAAIKKQLDQARERLPVPLFWLFGKTQSGKTSIIKFLTGADEAEIGQGFQPCTRFSRQYQFPTAAAPLMTFLDTRGLDEPGCGAQEPLGWPGWRVQGVAFHGVGGSENMFFESYGHGAIVDRCRERGWLLVAPKSTAFGGSPALEIVDELARIYPVDLKRVMLVGHSMGAGQAVAAASKMPEARPAPQRKSTATCAATTSCCAWTRRSTRAATR